MRGLAECEVVLTRSEKKQGSITNKGSFGRVTGSKQAGFYAWNSSLPRGTHVRHCCLSRFNTPKYNRLNGKNGLHLF